MLYKVRAICVYKVREVCAYKVRVSKEWYANCCIDCILLASQFSRLVDVKRGCSQTIPDYGPIVLTSVWV